MTPDSVQASDMLCSSTSTKQSETPSPEGGEISSEGIVLPQHRKYSLASLLL